MARIAKHAFVTGGGSGIGFAVAKTLGEAGWRVTITSRNKERLETAARAINGVQIQSLDVTNPESVRAAVKGACETSGPVQLLVNNAGGVSTALFEKTSTEAWQQTIDLNLMGTVHCTQAVLPAMKASGWGRIVNIASTAGLTGYRYVSAYVAVKHAVVGLTKSLALELAKSGITVNAVCPGYTDTEVIASAVETISKTTKRSREEALTTFTAANPQGRLVKPEEVAAAVLWLASEDAAAVNGIALPIAGGEV
ncbi:MAG: SDR family oxidoreductase [Proteobacteria bacterium]|nr:SDR family oxidoreductase [Pseudomonadota bacterium]